VARASTATASEDLSHAAGGLEPRPGRVYVAMSGGVDSSVAALLFQRQGLDVTGVTFKLFGGDDDTDTRPCCSAESACLARAVCQRLGVPHYTLSFVRPFREMVIDRFVAEYAAGRTPNPCVLCNRHVKFGAFLSLISTIEGARIATGHHARIGATADGLRLWPGVDELKDQSYALCHLNQTTMPRVLLPIGELGKPEVRRLAREADLPTAEAPESQDICFVTQGGYGEFLQRRGVECQPGPIVTRDGTALGSHRGLPLYTVGQRKGLGLAPDGPYFVAEKRVADNALVVVAAADLRQGEVALVEVNWCDGPADAWPPAWPTGMRIMLRYRSRLVACDPVGECQSGRLLRLRLAEPMVIAPGQYGVLYDGRDGHVIGGGMIS